MILEICASNYQSAINAQVAGAHRIELCSELAVGGLTPSYGLLKSVIEALTIPVHVLIRPKSGSFVYTEEEFEIMKMDIELCKRLGCHGIVSGVLNDDRSIDVQRTKTLVALSKPLNFTFHRAFDQTPNPFEALEQLIEIDVDRILSSGQAQTAEKGIVVLNQLLKLATNRIAIMPGSGINALNCLVFKGAGFDEIHASATHIETTSTPLNVPMNSPKLFDETSSISSSQLEISAILKKISGEQV